MLLGYEAEITSIMWLVQVYMADGLGRKELFCISAIIGGGPEFTVVLGANFHRAYYTVYEYDARTDMAKVMSTIAWSYTLQAMEHIHCRSCRCQASTPVPNLTQKHAMCIMCHAAACVWAQYTCTPILICTAAVGPLLRTILATSSAPTNLIHPVCMLRV